MRTRKLKFEDDGTDWWEAYQNLELLSPACSQLITFGVEEFYGAHIIKNIDKLEQMILYTKGDTSKMIPFKDAVAEFIFHDLSDSIRICTCFENIMKGILMVNGYMVHTLKTDRLAPLTKRQFKRPIPSAYIKKCGITKKELSYKTVTFSLLLSDAYQAVKPLPDDVRSILKEINRSRNQLHLRDEMGTAFGQDTVADLRALMNYLDPWVKLIQEASARGRAASQVPPQ